MFLYHIKHIKSGRRYIGQTTREIKIRWKEHRLELKRKSHGNLHLQNAWNLYGEGAFVFEIIGKYDSLEELNEAEINEINKGENLYNLALGGKGHKHNGKSKKDISDAQKIPIVGMCLKTKKLKEYPSASDAKKDGFNEKNVRKCAVLSVDNLGRASISHRGWVWIDKENFSLIELERRANLAKFNKVRNEREVIGLNINNNVIITFRSATEAGRNGFNATRVRDSCLRFSSIHKGHVWAFNDTGDPQSLLKDKKKYVLSKPRRGPSSW